MKINIANLHDKNELYKFPDKNITQIVVAADMLAVRENKMCLSFRRNQQNDKCGTQDGWSNWPSTLAASALSIHIL